MNTSDEAMSVNLGSNHLSRKLRGQQQDSQHQPTGQPPSPFKLDSEILEQRGFPCPKVNNTVVEFANDSSVDTMECAQRPQHECAMEGASEQKQSEVTLSFSIDVSSRHQRCGDCITDRSTERMKRSRRQAGLVVNTRETKKTYHHKNSSDSDSLQDSLGRDERVSWSTGSNAVSSDSGAALVTASTSAVSSGEDRYSSTHTRTSQEFPHEALTESQNYHDLSARTSRQSDVQSPLRASINTSAVISDEYGLTVHVDDRIETSIGTNGKTASAVVALLPPPCSSSPNNANFLYYSSEGDSDKRNKKLARKSANTSSSRSEEKPNTSSHRNTGLILLAPDDPIPLLQQSYMKDTPVAKKPRLSTSVSSTSSIMSTGSGTEGGYVGEQDTTSSLSSEDESTSRGREGDQCSNKRKASDLDNNSAISCSSDFLDFGSDYGYSSGSIRSAAKKMNMSSIDPAELARITLNSWLAPKSRRRRSKKPCNEVKVDVLESKMMAATRRTVQEQNQSSLQDNYQLARKKNYEDDMDKKPAAKLAPSIPSSGATSASCMIDGKSPLFILSSDLMAYCMSYLEPPNIHDLLTMPLSKEWHQNFTRPQDLWRVLCLTPPFNAKFDSDEQDSGDEDMTSYPMNFEPDVKHLLGRYRLLYTSFVRCMKYLARIKDDAINGRAPSVIDYGGADLNALPLRSNESLKRFLHRARGIVVKNKRNRIKVAKKCDTIDDPIGVNDDGSSIDSSGMPGGRNKSNKVIPPKVTFGLSQLSARLLGPSRSGKAGNVNLPWSCAIYSIVNWMVAFADVEGIQTMCLKVLPSLLEDETQRTTAPLAGLTEIVLRGMVLFPDSVSLHTAAFHTIVLLARPLGGKEGMLFHSSMVNSSGIFNNGSRNDKNGIAVMLDSMRRFQTDEVLQAMSCWSLVNIALAPSQKAVLVKLGGIEVVANAMIQHPYDVEVQFRALFALINLVIPSVSLPDEVNSALQEQLGDVNNPTEKEVLDEHVEQITNLVVQAMKNFCSSEAILNRACLVLHNLSLTEEFHLTLLWTPNCYQMLEWCLANYRTDRVLQQSAGGTLHRLQTTLSNNEHLRVRFTSSLQSQDQSNLEQAHLEALHFHERRELLGAEGAAGAS